jgi:hypothetical protein
LSSREEKRKKGRQKSSSSVENDQKREETETEPKHILRLIRVRTARIFSTEFKRIATYIEEVLHLAAEVPVPLEADLPDDPIFSPPNKRMNEPKSEAS